MNQGTKMVEADVYPAGGNDINTETRQNMTFCLVSCAESLLIASKIQKDVYNMKSSKFYVIEYRYWDKLTESWISHISQEGYSSYEDARAFCLKRVLNAGSTDKPSY